MVGLEEVEGPQGQIDEAVVFVRMKEQLEVAVLMVILVKVVRKWHSEVVPVKLAVEVKTA